MTPAAARTGRQGGFTLVELLVVVSIVAVIGYALTEAVILGLRTTDATAAISSRSVAVQALASYFTGDAQSADAVSAADTGCATEPVFLHLTWTDQGVARTVSYGLDPGTGPEQELVRWSCSGAGSPRRTVLGHFSRNPDPAAPPVSARCDGLPCPASPGAPATVTLEVQAEPSLSLTVRRRAAP